MATSTPVAPLDGAAVRRQTRRATAARARPPPGGEGQPQTQAAIFTRYALFGQDLQAVAVDVLGRLLGADRALELVWCHHNAHENLPKIIS